MNYILKGYQVHKIHCDINHIQLINNLKKNSKQSLPLKKKHVLLSRLHWVATQTLNTKNQMDTLCSYLLLLCVMYKPYLNELAMKVEGRKINKPGLTGPYIYTSDQEKIRTKHWVCSITTSSQSFQSFKTVHWACRDELWSLQSFSNLATVKGNTVPSLYFALQWIARRIAVHI